MTTAFGNVYQKVILEYFKKQNYVGRLTEPTLTKSGKNRMCGDVIEITACISTSIDAIRFQAEGCALLKASAALMAETLDGLNWKEAEKVYHHFLDVLESDSSFDHPQSPFLIFCGMHRFPSRLQCLRLPWDTLFQSS